MDQWIQEELCFVLGFYFASMQNENHAYSTNPALPLIPPVGMTPDTYTKLLNSALQDVMPNMALTFDADGFHLVKQTF